MTSRKQVNSIRTDYLENWIGFYRAHGHVEMADALCKVARDVSAPIKSEEVDKWEKLHTPA